MTPGAQLAVVQLVNSAHRSKSVLRLQPRNRFRLLADLSGRNLPFASRPSINLQRRFPSCQHSWLHCLLSSLLPVCYTSVYRAKQFPAPLLHGWLKLREKLTSARALSTSLRNSYASCSMYCTFTFLLAARLPTELSVRCVVSWGEGLPIFGCWCAFFRWSSTRTCELAAQLAAHICAQLAAQLRVRCRSFRLRG